MKILHAEPLQMKYDNGFLRQIRLGDAEVLRMWYFAVRDQNWATIPLHITKETCNIQKDSFSIDYQGVCQQNEIHFEWQCKINGSKDGSITFEIHGKALSDFLRNRIGFCILHPIKECAGQPVFITHTDRTKSEYHFPHYISPYQPFKDITSMQWQLAGATATLHFTGDIFETEDQRNWMDASYKTYCTPLHLPFPAQVNKGDEIHQKIEFKTTQISYNQINKNSDSNYTLYKTNEIYAIPPLGLEANTEELDALSIQRLQELNLSFLRVEMHLQESDWESDFKKSVQQAILLQLPIQLVLFLNKNWDEEQAILHTYHFSVLIRNIILVDIQNKTLTASFLNKVLPTLKSIFTNIPIGGGTNAYFTEFNRHPPPASMLDFAAFSVNPQVHTFDELSLIENLETPVYIIESAKKLVNIPISVTPVTLRPRFNPDAIAPEIVESGKMPFRVDPRQRTDFGAVWTLGSVLAFIKTGIQDLVYFQTLGEEGLLMPNRDSKYTDFEAKSNDIFPVYDIFKLFEAFKNGNIELLKSNTSTVFDGFIIKSKEKSCLVIINYTPQPIEIQFSEKFYSLSPYQILIKNK